jgi:hypothetical protein
VCSLVGDPELARQVPPGASAGPHVPDRGEHRPVIDWCGTAALAARGDVGISGSVNSHNSSGTSRLARSEGTAHDHPNSHSNST